MVSSYDDSDWQVDMIPGRIELIIGGDSEVIYARFWFDEVMENEDLDIWFTRLGGGGYVGCIPSPDHSKIWTGRGDQTFVVPFAVNLMPNFPGTEEIRLDFSFMLTYKDNTVGLLFATASLYILPATEGTWEVVSYTPQYATMTDNEEELLYLRIRNNSSSTQSFNIAPKTLHEGFSVTPSSGSISVDPDDTYEWVTTLKCTSFGLVTNTDYIAVNWQVTNVNTGITVPGGYTKVTYIGQAPPPITDIELVWVMENNLVPFGQSENAYIVIKNIGDVPLTITGTPPLTLTWMAWSSIWPVTIHRNTAFAIAAGENENIPITFWAHGDPEVMDDWAGGLVSITDNFGNRREAYFELRAVVGTFSLSISPEVLTLQRGQTQNVTISIKNNENANRSYIITAEEEYTQGVYWARSDPPTDNVALTPFTSRQVTFQVTATAPTHGIYPYVYYVRCEQTGYTGRAEIDVKIVDLPTGVYPGAFGSFLVLLNPLTGSTENSGYIMSVVSIMMFMMMGMAVGGDSYQRIGAIIMTVFGITLVTVLGWFPSWIMGLTILILALGMARWMHDYF